MDDGCGGAEPRALRGLALVVGLGIAGCTMAPVVTPCARGQQRHEGQCIPTSTLVFERCLETFRKTRVQREHGVQTEVSGQVQGQGAAVRRERLDTEQSEYHGLPDAMMGEAIDECRRQEQQQRTLELERAWAAADQAQQQAQQADDERRAAERAQRRAEGVAKDRELAEAALAEEVEALRRALQDAETNAQQEYERMAQLNPCQVQAWERCAAQALADKHRRDYPQAHDKYRMACEGGSTPACANWGVMFEHGLGVAPDLAEARRLYAVACEAGSPQACVNLERLSRGYEHDPGIGPAATW